MMGGRESGHTWQHIFKKPQWIKYSKNFLAIRGNAGQQKVPSTHNKKAGSQEARKPAVRRTPGNQNGGLTVKKQSRKNNVPLLCLFSW